MSLKYQLKGVMMHNKDGSFETQKSRGQTLLLSAQQLKEGGYQRLERPAQLKQKHMNYLVSRWQAEGLATSTIKNRVAHLRWLAQKLEKPTIVRSNAELGIEKRTYVTQENKAIQLNGREQKIADERIRDALRLQEAFGLRREEALKFKPELAARDQTCVQLQASWCKGGRARTVPIRNDDQRALLAEIRDKYPTGSLIHKDMTYKEMRDKYDNATKGAGLGKCHGLRHSYAQRRYEELSGQRCSVQGGLTRGEMTPEQREKDFEIRLKISEELGHGRVDVVAQYIGK